MKESTRGKLGLTHKGKKGGYYLVKKYDITKEAYVDYGIPMRSAEAAISAGKILSIKGEDCKVYYMPTNSQPILIGYTDIDMSRLVVI